MRGGEGRGKDVQEAGAEDNEEADTLAFRELHVPD